MRRRRGSLHGTSRSRGGATRTRSTGASSRPGGRPSRRRSRTPRAAGRVPPPRGRPSRRRPRRAPRLDQREARLVLDVLELETVGTPDEHRVGVLGVLHLCDLEPALLGFLDVVAGGPDARPEVVEERPLGLAAPATLEADLGLAGIEIAVLDAEAELAQLLERGARIGHA